MAATSRDTLPAPDPDARSHSERVREHIHAAIAEAGGALPFDRYMALALYAPGLGYYAAGQARFGAAGDYTTAPLMSALYSRTLARQCAEVLAALGGGEILELGGGTGRMAADVLTELARLNSLPERYRMLEVSAALREEQAATLDERAGQLAGRVSWLDRLPDAPVRGIVLANEVMDALPVKRFRMDGGEPREIVVTDAGDGGLRFDLAPPSAALAEAVAAIEDHIGERLPSGYTSEWCPGLTPWVASVSDLLDPGVALLVDYGLPRREYYHAQRAMGTLMCHYRHRAHDDALHLPGLQDITAYVDFSAAADAAAGAGAAVAGYNTQAHFLMGAGLPALLEEAAAEDPELGITLTQEAKPLLFPGELGERFKVLALARGYETALSGFALFDQRERL